MVQDQPPRNRAERRKQARQSQPKLVRPQSQNQKPVPEQVTGTGSSEDETPEQGESLPFTFPGLTPDAAPKGRGRPKAASKTDTMHKTLVSYYALAGLGVSRFDQIDGQIIMASADEAANAWLAAGKADPRIQRALEIITVAGPYTALIWVHAQMVIMIMDRHGANPLKGLFSPATPQEPQTVPQSEPQPLPYVPVGPQAPVDASTPPPQYNPDTELGIPDEGLPAEIDILLREAARTSGRPYAELRQEALVELAQMRLQRNGRTPAAPAALGAPIVKE